MKRIAFVAVWILLCLGGLELVLQVHYRTVAGTWLPRRAALPLWAPDPDAGFRLRPSLQILHESPEFRTRIYTDAAGFRVGEAGHAPPERTKSAGTRRILLLGPSFAFGWGVDFEDTFLERLGQELRRGLPPGTVLELINAGVPALGPVQQLAWFREHGRDWQPDLVIQLVYGSPYVSADYSESMEVTGEGYLVPRERGWRRRTAAALKRVAIVYYGWMAFTRFAAPAEVEGGGRKLAATDAPFDAGAPDARDALSFYDAFAAAVREAGAVPLVVYLPLAYRVYPGDVTRWRHRGITDPEAGRARNEALLDAVRQDGVPVADLTDDLRAAAAADTVRLYYRIDIHWTAAGHAAAARAVAGRLLAAPERWGLAAAGG